MTPRPFADADLDAVIALSLRAWAPVFVSLRAALAGSGTFERMYTDWRVEQAEAVRAAVTDLPTWVVEVDGAVAGFVAARLHEADGMGEIHMLAVDPVHQRHGVGKALTAHALEWFRANGMTLAMVETGGDPGHAPARRTYERAGFVPLAVARYFKAL